MKTLESYLCGAPPRQAGLIKKQLGKVYRFSDGTVLSVQQRVEYLAATGQLELETFEEDKIKPMSRMAFFRATNKEQAEHERRVKAAGKVTVFLVNGSNLGKIAYDYARFLSGEQQN